MTTETMHTLETLAQVGPFAPLQIAVSAELHELLVNPVKREAGALPLTYHGGKTIVGGSVFNIHLGLPPAYNTADFDDFTRAIAQNGYYLSPDGKDASPSHLLGSVVIPNPFSSVISDVAITGWLRGLVSSGTGLIPKNDGATLYSIIMPPNTTVSLGGSQSCSSFCGYHSKTTDGIYYAVICDTSCVGCHGSFTPAQGRMMVQAHEYAEWRSDPDGNAWYNDGAGMENADECAWQILPWGPTGKNWVVQPFAVNGKGCYAGAYAADLPPPPPPPPPPPVTGYVEVKTPNGGLFSPALYTKA